MAHFGYGGHFRSIFGLGVTLGPFWVLGSFRAQFGFLGHSGSILRFGSHFRSISGLEVTSGPFRVLGHFGSILGLVVTLGQFRILGSH